jgi:serine/threonine protein kinase
MPLEVTASPADKPASVLLTADGTAKITNFGLAWWLDDRPRKEPDCNSSDILCVLLPNGIHKVGALVCGFEVSTWSSKFRTGPRRPRAEK